MYILVLFKMKKVTLCRVLVDKDDKVPAIGIIVKPIYGAIITGETNIIKASNSQSTVCSDIHKVLFFPSLSRKLNKL